MSEHLPLPDYIVGRGAKPGAMKIAPEIKRQHSPAAKIISIISERDVLNALEILNLQNRTDWRPDHKGETFSWSDAYVSIYEIEDELCRLHNIPERKIIHRTVKCWLNRLRLKHKIDEILTDLSFLRPYEEYQYCSNALIARFPTE